MLRVALYVAGITATQAVTEHVTEDVHLQVYAPFAQLGALAVFALLMFLFMRGVIGRMMSQTAAREIAERKERAERDLCITEAQAKIALTMENHLGSIAANQARTAEALDLIVNRLLDAALRK